MIDFHNHILPGIDDGAKDLETSISMLRYANEQGITDVVNTVHYQHPKMNDKNISIDYIQDEISKLQVLLDNQKIPINIHIGAEVYYLPNLSEIVKDPLSTFGNGKYMLIEFPFLGFPIGYEDELFNLNMKGTIPVIAHPERYREVHLDLDIVQGFVDKGYVAQLDAGSLLGHFGNDVKECAFKIVNSGLFHLIGSDAHNNKKRNFCLGEIINLGNEVIEENKKTIFISNPNCIIIGEPVSDIICDRVNKNRETFFDRYFSSVVDFFK